jgi:hypothetical protein
MTTRKILPLLLAMCMIAFVAVSAHAQNPNGKNNVEVSHAVRHDISRPLREMTPIPPEGNKEPHEHPVKPIPQPDQGNVPVKDEALQTAAPSAPVPAGIIGSFDGIGIPNYGVNAAPPDTNGAVGLTQYVQWVNEAFGVFDKATGTRLFGPANGNTLWQGFGGPCETRNDGDPIVQYDKAANRWIMTQFAVPGGAAGFHQCVAVSQTADATGAYFRYQFDYTAFNDYPKVGVWPDAYYVTYNMFTSTFQGARVCALDRAKMLAGQAATQQCVQLSTSFGGLLPADLDGATAPPAGAPNYVVNFGSNSLNVWKFHVDWAAPANTTFTGPTNLPVAAFTRACNGGACIPQSGTTQSLDSLADRLMYRLAYRNFGDHQSLVVNHSVNVGTNKKNTRSGVRWYELRISAAGVPSVFQQGTFSPDSAFRWMGSAAMDKVGNIGMGYSVSSSTLFPSIKFTGRSASDPLGTLQDEISLHSGNGSQLRSLNRWGDYSSLSVDPVDDCTLWYTTEYLQQSGTFNWSTRIGKIKFGNCN